ncbi:MAG: alanine--tRNA ligase [Archaeoglobales archaeon]|nr:alanine--tRNA ligase [Archaeoglobales archaeon]
MSLEKEYLDITFLKENEFVRKKCVKCGKNFWTADENREICNDPPCSSYAFIGKPIFKRSFELEEMREYYLSFFEKRGHERINRYPVVARWRDDIYLTIASIADFQPFVTSGIAPPPANPLTISQPCIRLDDLDSIGRTGRHLTLFEMMAHHAFNYPQKQIYWKNETVAYCTELLMELGVKKEEIVYKEEPWAGGGNAGPCLEAIVGGLELATLVFMNLQEDEAGDIEIKGSRYRKMENYIVDTGYGLERFVWASKGTPTVYDAIFPEVINLILKESNINVDIKDKDVAKAVAESSKVAGISSNLRGQELLRLREEVAKRIGIDISELSSILDPLEKIYALADHTRCVLFMLGDGLVPSNSGGGYLARLMIRRSFRLAEELQLSAELADLIEAHFKKLKFTFEVPMETIEEILTLEKKKYEATIGKGIKYVERILEKKKGLSKEDLVELYDAHGITAELSAKIAEQKGFKVEVPQDFYSELAKKHSKAEKKEEKKVKLSGKYPPTKKLYHEDPKMFEFEARVIGCENGYLILDKTAFYPESGGQENDLGYLMLDGKKIEVFEVVEVDGVVLHRVGVELKDSIDKTVRGYIDAERRLRLMRHHSATHVLLHTLQKMFGNQVWQAGAKKEEKKARLDVTHYKKLEENEVREVERLANRIILENKQIETFWMDRIEAEKKFGFRLYQGGVPPGKVIRVVKVGENVQACGGTHCSSTGEIGLIKILKVESIQDGVLRFEFAAGDAAIDAIAEMEAIIKRASEVLRVEPLQLPKTVEKFFEEWKEQKKEIDKLKSEIANLKAENLLKDAETFNSTKIVAKVIDGSMKDLIKLAEVLVNKKAVGCIMASGEGKVYVVAFSGANVDARDILNAICRAAKGSGGGKRDIAQGAVEKLLSEDEIWKIIYEVLSR